MKSKDDLILEQLYQEGIIDRLGGQFKGVKAGGGQLLQNLGRKIYQKAGGEAMPAATQTAGQAYAKAQQTSLLNSFTKKANKEIEDFKSDLLALGVSGDPEEIKKTHPVIAQRIKQVESLLRYLNNPTSVPPPAAEAPAATETEAPAATETEAPAATETEAPAAEAPAAEAPAAEAPAASTTIPSIWLNTQQARNYLNITNKELWNLSKSGKIKAVKRPNGNYKFSRQTLEKYKNSLSTSTESYNPFADFLKKYNLI
jgi:hypothetical protein